MKSIHIFLSFLIAVLLVSCGPRVTTTNPDATNLSNYNTFAYLPNANMKVAGKKYDNEQINTAIVEAVKTNLQKRNFTIDRDNPDMLVLISTSTDIEVETTTEPVYATYPYTTRIGTVSPYYEPYYYRNYYNYGRIIGYDTDTYAYKEGTVVINLIDRKTKETVWKGVATDNIYSQTSSAAIQDMVDDIFEEFPRKKK